MNVMINDKKCEAIKRLMKLGISSEMILAFMNNDQKSISINPIGFNDEMNEKYLAIAKKFEKKQNCLVYYAIQSEIYGFYQTITFLYVSKYKKEWEMDLKDLAHGQACSFVYNETEPELSEIGYVDFERNDIGGLIRTA